MKNKEMLKKKRTNNERHALPAILMQNGGVISHYAPGVKNPGENTARQIAQKNRANDFCTMKVKT